LAQSPFCGKLIRAEGEDYFLGGNAEPPLMDIPPTAEAKALRADA